MEKQISDELKGEYLNQTADKIVVDLNKLNHKVYKRSGRVYDLAHLSATPDGGGDIYLPRAVLHIREQVGRKPILLGLLKKSIERSLVMLEHGGDKLWKAHVLVELSDVVKTAIESYLQDFSAKIGDRFQVISELNIPYKKRYIFRFL